MVKLIVALVIGMLYIPISLMMAEKFTGQTERLKGKH